MLQFRARGKNERKCLFSHFFVVPQKYLMKTIKAFMKPYLGTNKKRENTNVSSFYLVE